MQYTLKHIAEMLAKNLGQLEKGELKFEDVHSLTEQSRELYEGLIALRYAIAEKGLKPNDNTPFRIHPGQTSLIDAIDEVVAETNQKNDLFSSMLFDQTEEEEEEEEEEGELESEGELERDAYMRPEDGPAEENNPDSEPTPEGPEVMFQPVGDVEEIGEELEGEIEGESEEELESEEEADVSVAQVQQEEKPEPDPNDDSLAAKLSRSPIEDLRKAIGLNQKFQFIRELFDGDASSYDAFVDGVNGSNSLEEAMSLVNDQVPQLASKEEGDEVVEVFMDLIERRFL